MPEKTRKINEGFKLIGFDFSKFFSFIKGLPFYFRDFARLKKQKRDNNDFYFYCYPVLDERFVKSGTMSGEYFHQDLHVARRIFQANPKHHLDIGSQTNGFVAHVAAFREIEIMDIRDQKSDVKNISFKQADLMQFPEGMESYCDSISALHSVEHFGLGRYGDPIDYYGHIKAIKNIARILKTNGVFYFSVPIGEQRIAFNAHRVFSIKYLLGILEEDFNLKYFSYVDDKGDFFENVQVAQENTDNNFGCNRGCGIFELIKK
jgi:SAM-dependent methyltransferase